MVTGIGLLTPLGGERAEVWHALVSGRSGIAAITAFDASELRCRIAGQVPDDALARAGVRDEPRIERFTQLAQAAAAMAVQDAQLALDQVDGGRVGIVLGTAYGGISRVALEGSNLASRGPKAVPPHVSMSSTSTAAAVSVSISLGITGRVECASAACASGAVAIARGVELIEHGDADIVLAGGTDAAVTPLPMAAFAAARALSTRNDDPAGACRPFDVARDGFVFGEGACVLVLEQRSAAEARGAPVLAEVVGVGHAAEAFSLSAPDPTGQGLARSMRGAIESAGIACADVGYVNAHAAATASGDLAEMRAMRSVFGPRGSPPTSSTKSMTGHLLGAAGAFEAAVTVLALHEQCVPPTINVETLDPECDLDVVANHCRPAEIDVALSNSVGLGGINCTLAFARP